MTIKHQRLFVQIPNWCNRTRKPTAHTLFWRFALLWLCFASAQHARRLPIVLDLSEGSALRYAKPIQINANDVTNEPGRSDTRIVP